MPWPPSLALDLLLCRLSVCLCFWKMSLYWNTQPQLTCFCFASKAKYKYWKALWCFLLRGGPVFFLKGPLSQKLRRWIFPVVKVYQALTNFGYFQKQTDGRRWCSKIHIEERYVGSLLAGCGWAQVFSWSYVSLAWIWIVCLFWVAGRVDGNYRELGGSCFLVLQLKKGWCWFAEPSPELTWATTLSSHPT